MSPDHFARLFKQATGRTPHQYVVIRRIERAKRLLRETEWPIIDLSRQVGFQDQSYFTAVFRKHAATTPKAYRDDAHQSFLPGGRPSAAERASGASPPSAEANHAFVNL
jgi:AraC family transcriptional regulator